MLKVVLEKDSSGGTILVEMEWRNPIKMPIWTVKSHLGLDDKSPVKQFSFSNAWGLYPMSYVNTFMHNSLT